MWGESLRESFGRVGRLIFELKMKGFFDFDAFEASCMHLDKALAMVTPENCNALDDDQGDYDTIIDNYCWYGEDENVNFVEELLKLGCVPTVNSLGYAIVRGKPKIVRKMLLRNPEWVSELSSDWCDRVRGDCMVYVVETGLVYGFPKHEFPDEAEDYMNHRNSVRSCAIKVLFALRRVKDVSRIIARVVWSSRFQTFNPLQ